MSLNTYILLCEVKQEHLATLQEVGEDLKERSESLTQDDVRVTDMFLTTTEYEVVLVVQAPSEDEATAVLKLFASCEIQPDDVTTLTVTKGPTGDTNAFEGHTKM